MATVNVYLNFNGNCNAAFNFYQQVFQAQPAAAQLYDDIPASPDHPPIPEDAKGKVMHTSLKIGKDTLLMGSDVVEGFGHQYHQGNSTYIMLDTDSKAEAENLHQQLSKNALQIEMGLEETFFAELYASFQDQFGIWWMIHYQGNKMSS